MSKVKPLLPIPVAAARRVHRECDVRHPRDIVVATMAARYGAMIAHGPLATARGSIVRSRGRAVIWVDEKEKGEPRGDFTAAHELGHYVLHEIVDHFAQCHGQVESGDGDETRPLSRRAPDDKRTRRVEKEANHFSAELLMPEDFAARLCDVATPSLDDVYRLARTFKTSFHASALRFVEVSRASCAFVHSVGGLIKRSTETDAFPGAIKRGHALHPRTLAAKLQYARAGSVPEAEPHPVSGAAWGDAGGAGFLEQAIVLGPELGVWSWIAALS